MMMKTIFLWMGVLLVSSCGKSGEGGNGPAGPGDSPTDVSPSADPDVVSQHRWAAVRALVMCTGAEHGLARARTLEEAHACLHAAFVGAVITVPVVAGSGPQRARQGFRDWHKVEAGRVCAFTAGEFSGPKPDEAALAAWKTECEAQLAGLVKAAGEGKEPLLVAADYLAGVKVPGHEPERVELETVLRATAAQPAPQPAPEETPVTGTVARDSAGVMGMKETKDAPVAPPMVEDDASLRMLEKSNPEAAARERQKRAQRAAVVAVMNARRPEVVACYKKARAKDNYLQGSLKVTFTVTAPGKAASCTVARPLADPSVGTCACARLLTWKFAYPEGPDFTHTWSWTLTLGD
ncbi:AgmX/PglI C-terminal domain-containing protein [Myxococcota bacterium]|nr:AgmX/PglI C-terminal domain-containing protein [Myxococcota bacterium]MBU1511947.1 AgmX/PglI C-terminal domain-containing protein [Myxococcota bacterium]